MTTLLNLLPALTALVLAVALLGSIITLFRRRQHPRRILQRGLGGASMLAIINLIGIVPAALWWLPLLLTLALVAGLVVACRRVLTPVPTTEMTPRKAKELTAPDTANFVVEVLLYLALLTAALLAG